MITRNQFEEIYPLVNEIVAFSDSFANEDNSLFRYFKTMGKVYGPNDLMKIIRSNLLADLLHCYFTLGYQQNYTFSKALTTRKGIRILDCFLLFA